MDICCKCKMPIFAQWHSWIWTTGNTPQGAPVHLYCHFDNFMVASQKDLRRDRISVP